MDFRGSMVALVTAFTRSGDIDEAGLQRLVNFQIDGGSDVIIPCGTTGEGATMSWEEKMRVTEIVLEAVNSRCPVIMGVGSNVTQEAIVFAQEATSLGIDGLLSVSPYYNKPTQRGLYEHFRAISEATDLPIIVYNVPSRTGQNVEPGTLLRLAEIETIVAVKESSMDIRQIMRILNDAPASFRVLSGDDLLTYPILTLGGDGVISVAANEAPGEVSQMVHRALDGRFDEARRIHYELLPLMEANFLETNPIPVKTALEEMGLIEAHFRPPLVPMEPTKREQLKAILDRQGLLPERH